MKVNFNSQTNTQFGARLALSCPKGLLTQKQTAELYDFASHIGHKKNIINIKVDGDADNFTVTEAHKVFASNFGSPMNISKTREYNKLCSGDIFNVCMQRLENVKKYCDRIGLY